MRVLSLRFKRAIEGVLCSPRAEIPGSVTAEAIHTLRQVYESGEYFVEQHHPEVTYRFAPEEELVRLTKTELIAYIENADRYIGRLVEEVGAKTGAIGRQAGLLEDEREQVKRYSDTINTLIASRQAISEDRDRLEQKLGRMRWLIARFREEARTLTETLADAWWLKAASAHWQLRGLLEEDPDAEPEPDAKPF